MPDASEVPVLVAPLDEHNATLVRNVHPPDWRPPTLAGRYNLVVIGAGTAGLRIALTLYAQKQGLV
jgi:cation diffusion facilitator CzcD-associated flavoprotein CzcO